MTERKQSDDRIPGRSKQVIEDDSFRITGGRISLDLDITDERLNELAQHVFDIVRSAIDQAVVAGTNDALGRAVLPPLDQVAEYDEQTDRDGKHSKVAHTVLGFCAVCTDVGDELWAWRRIAIHMLTTAGGAGDGTPA